MAVNALVTKTSANTADICLSEWTLEKVQGRIDRACDGSSQGAGMVNIWMDMAHSRILTLLKSFLGDMEAPADWFHQEKQCAGDFLAYVHGGTRENQRDQPGYVNDLNEKLQRMVLDRPSEFDFEPPYAKAAKWKGA